MTSFKHIPFGDPEAFHVIIESCQGSPKKYAYDKELDAVKLSSMLYDGLVFPFDYGFIAQTESGDGDNLDAFIFSSHPLARGTIAVCRPVGILELVDNGQRDNKILAVPVKDRRLEIWRDLADLPPQYLADIKNFYRAAGMQWGRQIDILNFGDKAKARKELMRTRVD